MRSAFLVVLLLMVAITMSGCTVQRRLIKIPRTQENLQAFRECQRTVAVAIGYDTSGIERLKSQCLNTLESSSETVTTTSNTEQIAPSGCQPVEIIYNNDNHNYDYYYLCK